ncbi:MAG: DUF362 domain-containing protein [Candidatus Aenigmarchaeota archaeon]|nr:DUF362 domain-containing protein [Candidatus Aenigmarchaeota archaeon]
MSVVAHKKIRQISKSAVLDAVEQVMKLASWKSFVKGNVFVKVNLLSHQVVPGLCTSPWVLEGVLRVLQKKTKSITVGDADVATTRQVDKGAKNWGYLDVCKDVGARFVNLSKYPVRKKTGNDILKTVEFPTPLTDADSIVTIPVPKTHNVSTMTGALKNQWGTIPRYRHLYHDHVHEVIAEINKALKVDFAVADATVCIEGEGPRTGTPKAMNSVLASHDLVSLDATLATMMGFKLCEIPFIAHAEKLGIGSSKFDIIGDELEIIPFVRANISNHPVVNIEMMFIKIPFFKHLLFHTPLFKIFAAGATFYNTIVWHELKGKKLAKDFLKKNQEYAKEFSSIHFVEYL